MGWGLKGVARAVVALAVLAGVLAAPGAGQVLQGGASKAARPSLPGARLSFDAQTGAVQFLTTTRGRPIARSAGVAADAAPATAARAFLADHGSLFGVADEARDLRTLRTRTEQQGRSFVRFQQLHDGVPVLGGQLVVQLDGQRNTVATTGETLPDAETDVDVTPALTAAEAQEAAIAAVAKEHGLAAAGLSASAATRAIYDSRILGGPGLARPVLVWRTEVTSQQPLVDQLILVDAKVGAIALRIDQVEEARNRLTYTANNTTTLPGTLKCSEASAFPACAGGDVDVESAHRIAASVYDFYATRNGRDSYDNAGASLVSSVHAGSGYDGAFFDTDRNQMILGDAQTYARADDVIGHEITHGITARESNLFYSYQSGAINESLSDVFGELIDLTDGTGNDTAGVRWLLGEDVLPGGAIRSMKNPPAFGDPDRMTSPNYFASEDDGGGLHENSGVNNKAAYLMVDGDTFNGKTVTGIGIDKTELVYYEAATNLLTSASDYQDLYNALQQACANLTGTHGITSADCQQVKNALDAVEMNTPPPSAAPAEAPVCTSGTPTDLFVDNLENPASGNWSSAATLGANRWYYPQVPNPFGLETTWATSGVTNIWGADHQLRGDSSIARTASLTIPSGTTFLRFNHAYLFEHSGSSMFDGGVVEYSTNGGSTWIDAGSLFVNGGYNGALSSLTDNPLGTRQAFTGYSKGYGSSRIDLSSLAGQNVRFRFRLGLDTDGSDYGWFIDDVRVYQCGSGSGAPPGAPTGVTARTGDGEATVSFSAPANPGSTPITTYTVRVSPGGTTVTTPSTVAFVYGLVNGTQYTFTVSASNAAGEGPQSAPSAPVIPSSTQGRPPGPPAPEPRPTTPDPPPPVKRVPPP